MCVLQKMGPPEVHYQCKGRGTSKGQNSLHLLPHQDLPHSQADSEQKAWTKHLACTN